MSKVKRILRKIKLFFVPEYYVVLPVNESGFLHKPVTTNQLALQVQSKMSLMTNDELRMKYNVSCFAVIDAAVLAGHIKHLGPPSDPTRPLNILSYVSPTFMEACNGYTIVNKLI